MPKEEYTQREYFDFRFNNIDTRITDLFVAMKNMHSDQKKEIEKQDIAIKKLQHQQSKNSVVVGGSMFVAGGMIISFIDLLFKKLGL